MNLFRAEFMSLSHPHPIWTSAGSSPFEVKKANVQARMLSGSNASQVPSSTWQLGSFQVWRLLLQELSLYGIRSSRALNLYQL